MSNINDQKIMELKNKIATMKVNMKGAKKFTPITNCSIELYGVRINLNASNKDILVNMLVQLNMYKLSVDDLGISNFLISGYAINDWIADIKAKLDIIAYKDEEAKLQAMENKLHKLLSDDKKIELEISDIESMLK